ncbi:PREDICTED: calmodulin-A-like [Branchiostoma belcheri]|uniref:Calmodulin-A-like n=1 Tax=Branchiostoma belcheri TaxID=7741 RepID=A0A6P4XWZ3_BRABE|nr:PREDICTED: calmodulin-A-like [Branchiostoma belcheri]
MWCCYCTQDDETGSYASHSATPTHSDSFFAGLSESQVQVIQHKLLICTELLFVFAEYREAFKLFDKDGDGTITVEELGTVLHDLGQFSSEEDLNELLHDLDADGNLTIDFEDFVVILSSIIKEENDEDDEVLAEDDEKDLREAFSLFDKAGDGFIDASDLRQILSCFGQDLTDEEVDEMMCEIDLDGNGKIDYEEFVTTICELAQFLYEECNDDL